MGLFKPNVEKLKVKNDVKGLAKCLASEDAIIRGEASDILRKLKNPSDIETLAQALNNSDPAIRSRVARVLRHPDAVRHLITLLKDEVWYVRKEAVNALGVIKTPQAVEALIETLKDKSYVPGGQTNRDKSWLLRATAADALGKMKDPCIVEPLTNALNDEREEVQLAAKKALEKIKKKTEKTTPK